MAVEVELVRDATQAGGRAYAEADPAWQSGFRQAFLGEEEKAFRGRDQEALFRAGGAAGAKAAEADPPLRETLRARSDALGLARFDLPERVRDAIRQQQERSEILIGWIQLVIVALVTGVYQSTNMAEGLVQVEGGGGGSSRKVYRLNLKNRQALARFMDPDDDPDSEVFG